jgi:hypothetical protein
MATIRSDLESYVIAHDETQAHVLAPGAEVPDGVTIHPDLLEPEPEDPEESGDDGNGGEDKPPANPKTNRRSSRARKP